MMYIPRFKTKPFPFASLLNIKKKNVANKTDSGTSISQTLVRIKQDTQKINNLLPHNIRVLQVLVLTQKAIILVENPVLLMYLKRLQPQILETLLLAKTTSLHIELLKRK